MEWIVPVNEMLHDEITKLNYTLIPPGYQGDVRSVRVVQESLSKLINQLGEQSAAAQGLNKVITTADKLRNSPTYTLYLLKDAEAKGGAGEVIGLLKVGRKHLFLFDERDKVCEVEPLCVLDFFVAHDRQRRGYGRMLFERMLRDAGAAPHQLAIDGPSPKMERFLAKIYGVERLIRQNNNFAVAPNFFDSLKDVSKTESPASAPAAVGRFAAPKPHSAIANVIHGGDGGGFASNGGSRATTPAAPVAEPVPVPAPAPVPAPEPPVVPSRPSSLRVEPLSTPGPVSPAGGRPRAAPTPAGSTAGRRDSQLTELGYFDVKFYHNKLCKTESPASAPAAVGRFAAPKPHSAIANVIHGGDGGGFASNGLNALRSRPSSLRVEPLSTPGPVSPAGGRPRAAPTPAGSTAGRRDSQLTELGYFDVKFYHNKLW